ncbi:hypothetical protein Tco_0714338 [Tanacetum coccineum]
MAALVISISSDTSEESVGSHAPLVILFGVIPAILEVPVVPADPIVTPEVGAVSAVSLSGVPDLVDYLPSSDSDPSEDSLPPVPDLPLVSPFLCSDDTEADDESEPAEEGPVSSSHDTLAPLSEFPLAPVVSPPGIRRRSSILVRPVRPLPARRLAWRCVSHHSLDRHSSSDSSSSSAPSDYSLSGHTPPDTTDADSSTPQRFTTSESSLGSSSDRLLDSSSPSSRPSRRRCRSPTASVPLPTHVSRSIAPTPVDLLPPHVDISEGVVAHPEDGIERYRIDSIRWHMALSQEEFLQVRRARDDTRRRLRRLESTMTITRSGMTPEAIEELVNRRVEEALAAHEATHGENVNGGNGNGRNENPDENGRGDRPVARECTYQDFMKCQPLNFKGTEGVVGLIRWFEKMETVFHINNCSKIYQVKYATCTLLNNALTWWNSHKRTIGTEAAVAMSWRELMKLMTEVYCPRNERFQELTMMCTKMVPKEDDRVEKFIGGLPDNIQWNVIAAEPTTLQDDVRIANNLMDQKLKGYAVKKAENKRRFEVNQRDNRGQQPPFKRPNVGGQNVARAYTAGNNEKKPYNVLLPLCNKCKLYHEGPYTVRCGKCNKVEHLTQDCKVTISTTLTQRGQVVNHRVVGNKNRVGEARGKAYVLGGGDANTDSNVVKGTFLLNNHYAFILFDSGADRSFVSTTFSTLLDTTPNTLDVSYAVELADERISKTNTLANNHAVIVCDEKIVWIPYGDEVLIVQGDGGIRREKSKLSIISCIKTHKYVERGCPIFLAQMTKKETGDKSEEKRLEDVPTVRNFPEDLPGFPPTRQVEF